MKKYFFPFLLFIFYQSSAQFFKKDKGLAHTFSIVARDEKTTKNESRVSVTRQVPND
jgi:hypothetical protein